MARRRRQRVGGPRIARRRVAIGVERRTRRGVKGAVPIRHDWRDFQDLSSFDFAQAKNIVGGSERVMRSQFAEKVFIQCRLYDLLNPSILNTGIGSRNPAGRGLGMGLSLIGWIPDSEEEYYVNQEVGRRFVG